MNSSKFNEALDSLDYQKICEEIAIIDADIIVVMRDGRVVESGSHDELLKKGGEYSNLYKNQFAGFAT